MRLLESRASRYRKGVSGVIGVFILFALIFTAGVAYFQVVNQYKHASDIADVNRLSYIQQASSENLSLAAKLSTSPDPWLQTGDIYVSINNTGGVPSTIVGVLVSVPNGTVVSKSLVNPPSHFLSIEGTASQKGDLNVTLPLTLGVGVSTSKMSGCSPSGKTGCSIGIGKSSFDYRSGTVVVSLLTSLGNVFSLEYPTPHIVTMKNVFVISETNENLNLVDETFVNETIVSQSGVVGCYSCITDRATGGNILVVLITASPSPVFTGGAISVVATVWNYSPYPATGVAVALSTFYSGSATVSPDGSSSPVSCGSSTSISAGTSAPFDCSFVASTGGESGTVTFAGSAEGCVVTGTTTSCANGARILSATASSNPVQVGGFLTLGLWQLNYYYFTYTASSQKTPASPAIVPHSDNYVAFNLKVTNGYNTAMSILDNSYLQFVSPGSDVNEFIVASGSASGTTTSATATVLTDTSLGATPGSLVGLYLEYTSGPASGQYQLITANTATTITTSAFSPAPTSGGGDTFTVVSVNYSGTPSFTAYGCTDAPPSAPTDSVSGQQCITVAPGASVTISFAANSLGSTTWDWGSGDSPVGGGPYGCVINIIIGYTLLSNPASGTTTSATATVLTDTSLGATPGSLVGLYLEYTSGPASGQYQLITANTATTITTSAFSPAPTSGGGDTFTVDEYVLRSIEIPFQSVYIS